MMLPNDPVSPGKIAPGKKHPCRNAETRRGMQCNRNWQIRAGAKQRAFTSTVRILPISLQFQQSMPAQVS
jgi:hypothetical protein